MNIQDILFRAKRIGYDEWVEGFIFATYEHTYIALPEYFDVDLYFSPKNIFIEVIPETVCRYTGLVDKEGNKIFEGAILECRYDSLYPEDTNLELILWHNNGWHRQEPGFLPEEIEEENILANGVVIGNIYDNPELWEGDVK